MSITLPAKLWDVIQGCKTAERVPGIVVDVHKCLHSLTAAKASIVFFFSDNTASNPDFLMFPAIL